jgi:hypothetical protein
LTRFFEKRKPDLFASKAIFIGDDIFSKVAAQGASPTDKGLSQIDTAVRRASVAKVAERPRKCLQSITTPVRIRTLAF